MQVPGEGTQPPTRVMIANTYNPHVAPPIVRSISGCADCGCKITFVICPPVGSYIVCGRCGYRRFLARRRENGCDD